MTIRHTQGQDDFPAEPRSLDLREYWLIVRRRWCLVAIVALLGAVGGMAYARHAGSTYTAQAAVVVNPVAQEPNSASTPVTTQINMSTEQAIAQSAAVAQLAASKLGVPVTQLEANAAKRLSVTVPANTLTTSNVLQISWQASKPALAQQNANAFAAAYLSYRQRVLQNQVSVLQKNLQQQAAQLKKQISTLASQINGTTSGTTANQVLTVQLTQASQQYNSVETQLAAIPAYNTSGGQLIVALLPTKPSGLSKSVYIAIGFILGLLVGLIAAFARDLFDDRIHESSQMERHLGALTLAVLPSSIRRADIPGRHQSKLGPPPEIAMVAAPDSSAAEAVRALRAAVIAVTSRLNLRVILIVGADASVSGGQVAAELGVALAESDRLVLLIASDLRGSALPGIFGVLDTPGLSELLTNGGDLPACIYRPTEASGVPVPGMFAEQLAVLPSGHPTPSALSLLDSGRMQAVLRGQSDDHDFILLDAPPATVGDILSLAAHVDGVIVLARKKKTTSKDIEGLRHRLDQVGAPILGGVLIGRWHRFWGRWHGGHTAAATQPTVQSSRQSASTLAAEPDAKMDMTMPLRIAAETSRPPAAPSEASPEKDSDNEAPLRKSVNQPR